MSTPSQIEEKSRYDELIQSLDYNPLTGQFIWNDQRTTTIGKGDTAGTATKRGIVISFYGVKYQARRVAWYILYKTIPDGLVININNDMYDNRSANLALTNHSERHTKYNRGLRGATKTVGICFSRGHNKWRAYWCNRTGKHPFKKELGLFKTEELALTALNQYKDLIRACGEECLPFSDE